MKKFTKILSVFMAILMVFSCVPMTAFAAERDTSSLDAYLSADNLAVVVEDLLSDLGDRKEELVPTVLNLCFQFIKELNDLAKANGVDVAKASTNDLAKQLIVYLEKVLKEADLNSQIAEYKSVIGVVLGGVKVDLNSVDGVLNTLVGALDFLKGKGKSFCGDLASLSTTSLKIKENRKEVVISTKNSSGLDIVNALFGFISDTANIAVIKKVVKGNINLGSINATIKSLAKTDLEAEINGMLGANLTVAINEMLYSNLLAVEGSPAFADSIYKNYKSDELLAAALLKGITGKDASKAEATKLAGMTFYGMIGTYADSVFANIILDPLNNDLKKALNDLVNGNSELSVLKKIFNLNYEFKASSFNFSEMAKNGLFESLNDFVCTVAKVILQPSVYKELGLKTGSNKNITANLTSVFAYVLKTLAGVNKGKISVEIEGKKYSFDFSGFTADKIKGKTLEDMIVAVFALFYPSLLEVNLPAEVKTMEQLAGYSAYMAIEKFMVKDKNIDFNKSYKNLVMSNGKVKNLSKDQWNNVLGEMGMDVAIYWLNDSTDFGMTQKQVDALKAKGWTWEDFFEEIVDWALGYIKGIPAVSDELEIKRGVSDGFGPWYKLNVVLNELFPLAFINGCGDETFTFDIYTAVMEKIVPSFFDCDFAEFTDIFAKNNNKANPFNQKLIASVIGIIDNLLFSLFEHDCGKVAQFEKTATATQAGAKGTYCTANGHYVKASEIPALNSGNNNNQTTTPETPKYALGDVNGDSKVNAADARIVLRVSARLQTLAADFMAVADVNKDDKVNASDARKILRVASRLETF